MPHKTPKKTQKKSPEKAPEKLDSYELIYQLVLLIFSRKYKKKKPLPVFTLREALFVRDLIFMKPKDLVYFYIADHIGKEHSKFSLFYSRDHKRYMFFKNFIMTNGNATKAAIMSGYSPRSAKQQGHRALRYIQKFARN